MEILAETTDDLKLLGDKIRLVMLSLLKERKVEKPRLREGE